MRKVLVGPAILVTQHFFPIFTQVPMSVTLPASAHASELRLSRRYLVSRCGRAYQQGNLAVLSVFLCGAHSSLAGNNVSHRPAHNSTCIANDLTMSIFIGGLTLLTLN